MNYPIWQNDLQIKSDLTPVKTTTAGGNYRIDKEVTQSYITPIAGFSRPVWHTTVANPNSAGMVVTGCNVTRHSPHHYKVTLTWGYAEDKNEDEDGNEITDDPGSIEMGEGNVCKVKISDRTSVTLEPILSYHRLRKTDGTSRYPIKDMIILATYLSGGLVLCANGQYRMKSDPDDQTGYIALPTTPITKYITAGFKKVTLANTVYTKTYTARHVDAKKIAGVGKITDGEDFGGPDSVDGGYKLDYLFSRYSVHKIGKREYEITEEYTQSAPGGWNKELYS